MVLVDASLNQGKSKVKMEVLFSLRVSQEGRKVREFSVKGKIKMEERFLVNGCLDGQHLASNHSLFAFFFFSSLFSKNFSQHAKEK
mgnify:CR=1 FL=1